MPNICEYDMIVIGEEKNIKKLERIMNYKESVHMYRIFSADMYEFEKKDEKLYTARFCGDCAWSVFVCMMEGEACYYQGEEDGTSLLKLSKALDLKIEIYSSEPGMCFQEHYYIENGEYVINEETEYNEYWFEENLTKEELEDEFNGSITEDEYLNYQKSGFFSRGGFDWVFQL